MFNHVTSSQNNACRCSVWCVSQRFQSNDQTENANLQTGWSTKTFWQGIVLSHGANFYPLPQIRLNLPSSCKGSCSVRSSDLNHPATWCMQHASVSYIISTSAGNWIMLVQSVLMNFSVVTKKQKATRFYKHVMLVVLLTIRMFWFSF